MEIFNSPLYMNYVNDFFKNVRDIISNKLYKIISITTQRKHF